MEFFDNLVFLIPNSFQPIASAILFTLLGLWLGHVIWFDWNRQCKSLRAENRELRAAVRAEREHVAQLRRKVMMLQDLASADDRQG